MLSGHRYSHNIQQTWATYYTPRAANHQQRKQWINLDEEVLHGAFEDARIWALVNILPHSHWRAGEELSRELELLRNTWLGTVDAETSNAVLWNIAYRLLTTEFGRPKYSSRDVRLQDGDIRQISNNEPAPENILKALRAKYPEIFLRSKNIRTWADLKAAAAAMNVQRLDQRGLLKGLIFNFQLRHARARLGLRIGSTDTNVQRQVEQDLQGKSTKVVDAKVGTYGLSSKSAILVVAHEPKGFWDASMNGQNVLKVYPRFFEQCKSGLVTPVTETGLVARNPNARPKIILHEATHSRSSLETTDTETSGNIWTPEQRARDAESIANSPINPKGIYGLACLNLVTHDRENGTRYAEGNADNWANYWSHCVLHLAYPEYDFGPGFGLSDMLHGRRRSSLRHHSSLLDVLRHPDTHQTRDLEGYDKHRDPFWCEESGWESVPKTKDELLNFLIHKTDNQESQRANINAKLQAAGLTSLL